jgi:hypothetical protein
LGGVVFFLSTLIGPFVSSKIGSMGLPCSTKDSSGLLFEKQFGQTLLLVRLQLLFGTRCTNFTCPDSCCHLFHILHN